MKIKTHSLRKLETKTHNNKHTTVNCMNNKTKNDICNICMSTNCHTMCTCVDSIKIELKTTSKCHRFFYIYRYAW